jgi:hypothetical protein
LKSIKTMIPYVSILSNRGGGSDAHYQHYYITLESVSILSNRGGGSDTHRISRRPNGFLSQSSLIEAVVLTLGV